MAMVIRNAVIRFFFIGILRPAAHAVMEHVNQLDAHERRDQSA